MKIADDHRADGLRLVAVTDSSVEQTLEFLDRYQLPFAVLADAGAVRSAWQVDMIWGSPTYLVDAADRVVADEVLSLSERQLTELLQR